MAEHRLAQGGPGPADREGAAADGSVPVTFLAAKAGHGGSERYLEVLVSTLGPAWVDRIFSLEDGPLDLWLALNDNIADGRDVSWIWDADFELLAHRVRRVTCSGTRAEEMALRLKYAGVDGEIAVERDVGDSLDAAVADGDGGRPLIALPTYTAMLELRELLTRRGLARRWAG